MNHIKIASEYITLGQFLKYAGIISVGGEAKIAVKTHKILVNGASEDRRGRKLYPGDLVKVDNNTYKVEQRFKISELVLLNIRIFNNTRLELCSIRESIVLSKITLLEFI